MNPKTILFAVVLAVCAIAANAGRIFVLDDSEFEDAPVIRYRRDTPPSYLPVEKSGYHHKPGKVGPVYTFVKTDPYANFKWGVRHVAGKKYGR